MSVFVLALGVIGTLTGTAALAWQIHTTRQSRPRLKVTCSNAFPTYGPTLGAHHFAVTATNIGGAATEVTAWGFRLPDGATMYAHVQLPWSDRVGRIEPEGKRTFFIEAADVLESCKQRNLNPSDIRAYVASTTAGDILGNALPWKEGE